MARVVGEYPRRPVKRPSVWARWWESLLAVIGDEETLRRRRRSAGAKKAAATRKAKLAEARLARDVATDTEGRVRLAGRTGYVFTESPTGYAFSESSTATVEPIGAGAHVEAVQGRAVVAGTPEEAARHLQQPVEAAPVPISPGALAVLRDEFGRASKERKMAFGDALREMGLTPPTLAQRGTAEQGRTLLAVLRGEA